MRDRPGAAIDAELSSNSIDASPSTIEIFPVQQENGPQTRIHTPGNGLKAMSQDERLHIVPVPSLVATLLRRERDKGGPLTQDEVLAIRDQCPSVAMTDEMLARVVERRGYDDINPENAWEEWLAIRPSLVGGDDSAT